MASVKLTYYDPETAGDTSTTFTNVLVVRGWYDVDSFEFFPAIQHRYLSGSVDEQISGLRRVIQLDLGVVSSFASRKAILYFCLDTTRQIDLVIAAPANPSAAASAGGTLPDDQYFYRVTAVDAVGETVGCTEVNATTSGTDNSVTLNWDDVSGATGYRVYRSDTTATYGGTHFLIEVTASAYIDTGAVALTSTYQLPSVQALSVARQDFDRLASEWRDGYQEAKAYSLILLDQTLRSELIP